MTRTFLLHALAAVLEAAFLLAVGGCGGRNLYRDVKISNPPIERGYVYMTRDQMLDAGQDPVEFGTPVVTRDVVFVASETKGLEAFERSSFRRKWQFMVKNGLSSALALEGNTLYFGANDGYFYALDAEFGKVIWKYETKAPVYARAMIANKRVYINASDDVVYCLDQANGKWVWHYRRSSTTLTTVHGNSTPVIDGTMVHIGFSDGYIVTLNANDGNLIWEQKIHKSSKFTDVDAMPVVEDGRIYVPSYDGDLYALDRVKGKVLWHIDVGGAKKVLIDGKTLYLASSNGNIFSVNKDTGRIGWKFELDQGTPTSMIQHDDYLAFGSSRQYFYVIRKSNGKLAYRFDAGLRTGFFSTPVESEGDIFAFSNFGNLYIFRWRQQGRIASEKRW